MKKYFKICSFFLITIYTTNAQNCDFNNAGIEKWIDVTEDLAPAQGVAKNTIIFPDGFSPVYRFFFLALSSLGADPKAYWKSDVLGVGRDSTMAKSGKYAMKIGGDKLFEFADALHISKCKTAPASLTFNYRHIGTNGDTLQVLYYQAKDEDADLPSNVDELKLYPSSAISITSSKVTESAYKTITMPITKNFVDTSAHYFFVYVLVTGSSSFFASGGKSYFLLDDFKYNYTPSKVEDELLNTTSLYPNPTTGIVNLNSTSQFEKVRIYNMDGRLMNSIMKPENEVDMSELNKGIYLFEIEHKNNILERKKVVKE
jgi:hypothetical protein